MDDPMIYSSEEESLKMICGAFYISKAKSNNPQGDDAYFINSEKQTIGVADGVGGWWDKGIDPGKYARKLMSNANNVIQNLPINGEIDLKQILHSVNVGDSGFVIIREDEEATFESPKQQYKFNHTYQLGWTVGDRPRSAQELKIGVKAGEIIVVGTDGVFDNLFTKEIKEIVKHIYKSGGEPEQAAWAIAEHAFHNSTDPTAYTPFSHASSLARRQRFGGKKDDITAIVAYIVDTTQSSGQG